MKWYTLIKEFLFFIAVISFSSLSAASPHILHFSDFPTDSSSLLFLQDHLVQVRGFWYPLSEERGVLSPHSHLKSCCIASSDKIDQQIILKGKKGEFDSFPTQRVITVQGIFKIEPLYHTDGKLIQLYVLEQIQHVENSNFNGLLSVLASLFILFCAWYFFRRLREKNSCKIS